MYRTGNPAVKLICGVYPCIGIGENKATLREGGLSKISNLLRKVEGVPRLNLRESALGPTKGERKMSANPKKTDKVEIDARIAAIVERAEALNVSVETYTKLGLVEEAEKYLTALEDRKTAIAKAETSGRSNNRFDLFYRKIASGFLAEGKRPVGVEDREYSFGLLGLYPKEGRGGGSSDWASKGVAKSLATLSAANLLRPEYDKAYRAIVSGKATEGVKLPADIRDAYLALIPDNVKRAVRLPVPKTE